VTECEKEIEALKLLHKNWDGLPSDERQALHDNFIWAISSAVKVGLVCFPKQPV